MDYYKPHHHHHAQSDAGPPPYPPRYVMLSDNTPSTNLRLPPYRRNLPRYYSSRLSKTGGGLCGCLCCFCATLLITSLTAAALLAYLYAYLSPQLPRYSVEHLGVRAFEVRPDTLSLRAELEVAVRAEHPNRRVGIEYGKGGAAAVAFGGERLCEGELPAFFQGRRNTTRMRIVVAGEGPFGAGMQRELVEGQRRGRVPLEVTVKAPVALVVGTWRLREVTVLVSCALVIDGLATNEKARIISSSYKFGVKF
ncbi:hypothetical protein QJS10_CPB15g00996 [Acorus calamus]|uniref:Late embryogenesis abundant protein LEA-2 subgroup domain-containing protein n=1 Tax=Acorus calamus TaxID=4465 RepID=A0AAV9D7Q5_ACOCL|nr:hypothetical protein QJS10_CPB15g00996 [Acorus calamus]